MKKIAVFLLSLMLVSCFSPWHEEATLSINLGSQAEGRAATWPPEEATLAALEHRIELNGPGGIKNHTLAPGEINAHFTLTPGYWTIEVEAYLDGELYAKGSEGIEIKARQNNSVIIEMFQNLPNENQTYTYTVTFDSNGGSEVNTITGITSGATIVAPANPTTSAGGATLNRFRGWYTDNGTFNNEFNFSTPIIENITLYADWGYRAGDMGPCGGYIFYRETNSVGFTVDGGADVGYAVYTAYYLEAAPSGWYGTLNDPDLSWSSAPAFPYANITGTGLIIGTGRRNTALILTGDPNAPAAKACADYDPLNNWFLPSYNELMQLFLFYSFYKNVVPGFDPSLDYSTTNSIRTWSSSQYDSTSAHSTSYSSGPMTPAKNTTNVNCRPIRAF